MKMITYKNEIMRTKLLILLILPLIFSCSKSEEELEVYDLQQTKAEIPGTWKLYKTSGMDGSTQEENLEFQETYTFTSDNNFTKERITADTEIMASGVYSVEYNDQDQRPNVILTFDSQNEIIANNNDSLKEYLFINTSGELMNAWIAYDGPGLYYIKN
jgi:hypothetical protein